jgi:hypothetical protein
MEAHPVKIRLSSDPKTKLFRRRKYSCLYVARMVMIELKIGNYSHATQHEKSRVIEKQGAHKEEELTSEMIPYLLSMQRR